MGNYTFLAKNPRFCMQDRKVTIAGDTKMQAQPNTVKSTLKNNGQNAETASEQSNNFRMYQYNEAHSHISHNYKEPHNYDLNKPRQ